MQLAIDISIGKVLAKYNDGQHIDMSQYNEEVELVQWSRPFSMVLTEDGELPNDPRDDDERAVHRANRFTKRRLEGRPTVRTCLEMIYRDMRDGSTRYVDTLKAIDAANPDPRQTS